MDGGFEIDTRVATRSWITFVHSTRWTLFVAEYPKSGLRDVMAFQELVGESAFQNLGIR